MHTVNQLPPTKKGSRRLVEGVETASFSFLPFATFYEWFIVSRIVPITTVTLFASEPRLARDALRAGRPVFIRPFPS